MQEEKKKRARPFSHTKSGMKASQREKIPVKEKNGEEDDPLIDGLMNRVGLVGRIWKEMVWVKM